MISVTEAQTRLLGLVDPLEIQNVPLHACGGRTLGQSITAKLDQPPFDASAMDGYAIRRANYLEGAQLSLIGEAAAGAPFDGTVGEGQAVRILTGGAVPEGADMVLIQENVVQQDAVISVTQSDQKQDYIRARGQDFGIGTAIEGGETLSPAMISLAASMGYSTLPCTRRPEIAIIATGDELVQPGDPLLSGQIYASNSYGLKAHFEADGARVRILPIARDTETALAEVFAMGMGADLIISSGGASVGDHDLVMPVAKSLGLSAEFHKVRMRPGKPLMAGRFQDGPAFVGLPGNPVSSLVCAHVFVSPMLRKMLGQRHVLPKVSTAVLSSPIAQNGPREHYMRAELGIGPQGVQVTAFDRQDSALSSVMAAANALVRRAPDAPALGAGDTVDVLPLTKV